MLNRQIYGTFTRELTADAASGRSLAQKRLARCPRLIIPKPSRHRHRAAGIHAGMAKRRRLVGSADTPGRIKSCPACRMIYDGKSRVHFSCHNS